VTVKNEFHGFTNNEFNNFNAAVQYYSSRGTDDSRDRRISMTCSESRYNQIDSRSGNNSRLLELSYTLLESLIGKDGRLTPDDVLLIEYIKANAGDIITYIKGRISNGWATPPRQEETIDTCRALRIL
jgi:hypothetical protein